MKVNEYKNNFFEEGFYKFQVWDHKTVEAYGAAPVHLRRNTFENLKIFVDIMRPKLNPKCEDLFILFIVYIQNKFNALTFKTFRSCQG